MIFDDRQGKTREEKKLDKTKQGKSRQDKIMRSKNNVREVRARDTHKGQILDIHLVNKYAERTKRREVDPGPGLINNLYF